MHVTQKKGEKISPVDHVNFVFPAAKINGKQNHTAFSEPSQPARAQREQTQTAFPSQIHPFVSPFVWQTLSGDS
jgi:hypothetical protein